MIAPAARLTKSLPRVFDKYQLPKFAFGMVTTASLTGAVLTGLRHGWTDYHLLAIRWAAYWMLGLLLGAEIWRLFYLRPSLAARPAPPAVEYGEAMISLYRRRQDWLVPLALLLGGLNLAVYLPRAGAGPWAAAGAAGLLLALAGGALPRLGRRGGPVLSLVGLAAALAAMAGLDVALQPGNPWLLVPNRVLHVWAFSAWLGGAFWNIFVAVPAGMVRINLDTVILANFQLERFRVVVRTVFPTIIATGLVQVWAIFGWQWRPLFSTLWGYLVLVKGGLVLSLILVFILCPMWRACSPVRGVCDLDDLG